MESTSPIEVLPEDVLVATLYKVGDVRLPNDSTLAKLFNDAAVENCDIYGEFRWNPIYQHSKILEETLANIDLGGAIVRENLPSPEMYFRPAKRTLGGYGEKIFTEMPQTHQKQIKKVAEIIREQFSGNQDSGRREDREVR